MGDVYVIVWQLVKAGRKRRWLQQKEKKRRNAEAGRGAHQEVRLVASLYCAQLPVRRLTTSITDHYQYQEG